MNTVTSGTDSNMEWIKAQANNYQEPVFSPVHRMAGYIQFPPKNGVFVTGPTTHEFPWTEEYLLLAEPGQKFEPASFSSEFMASFIVYGDTEVQVEDRLKQVADWYLSSVIWEQFEHPVG